MAEVISSYTTRDGIKLFYRTWSFNTGQRKDTVPCLIVIHGIESHSGWFAEVGEVFGKFGLEVYALDRRGSGLNNGSRGDVTDFQTLIHDIDDFFYEKGLADRKCILTGYCWGAKPVLKFLLGARWNIYKVIFITPGFKTKIRIPFMEKIRWLRAMLFSPATYLDIPIKPEMFTRDHIYLEKIKSDLLLLKHITPRFFKENLRLERSIRRSVIKVDIPSLLLLAEEDEIIDNSAVIEFMRDIFQNLDVISYAGCRHGIFFEPKKDEVMRDIANWILK